MPLPIVARILGVHKTEMSLFAVRQSLPLFDLIDEIQDDVGLIQFYGRKFDDDGAASKLIVIPAPALKMYGKPSKTDIRWLWKHFNHMKRNDRARWSDSSVLTMLWTNEPELYVASNQIEITTWSQPAWVWAWIKYVHQLPIHLQKKGVLKFVLGETVEAGDDAEIFQEVASLLRHQKKETNA